MSCCVAFLRGINVGGCRVAMSDLREMFATAGFSGAQTLLQTGNVIFAKDKRAPAEVERQLEAEATTRFGRAIDFLVRSATEFNQVIAENPFPEEARKDPAHLLLMLLKKVPTPDNLSDLQASIAGPEQMQTNGRHLYIVYPAGIGRSKLTGSLIERKLATRGTARNWNTVLKLQAISSGGKL